MSSSPKPNYQELIDLVATAQTILILQPDSPDGDSLGTALGLEEILGDQNKLVYLYSYREPEPYLRNLEGWDRVRTEDAFPKAFDLTVVVDTGSPQLIKSTLEHHFDRLTSKPVAVIDHHVSHQDFGLNIAVSVIEEAVAAAEIVTRLATAANWTINPAAAAKLASGLLADSQGLTTSGTTADSVEALATLTRAGANLHQLHVDRIALNAPTPDILHLKGRLLESVEFYLDNRLALAVIDPETNKTYKDVTEPYALILNEMQRVKGVELIAVFKNYGTKINVPLRSNTGAAGPMAEHFDGGGHPNAGAYRCQSTDVAAEKQLLIDAYADYLAKQEPTQESTQEPVHETL
jgi:phosphoesterase RecJ-like protein